MKSKKFFFGFVAFVVVLGVFFFFFFGFAKPRFQSAVHDVNRVEVAVVKDVVVVEPAVELVRVEDVAVNGVSVVDRGVVEVNRVNANV